MTVNWKDIQDKAEEFVPKYIDAKDEDRDAKPFWQDLMTLYGVEARSIGAFEERVRIYGRPGVGKIDYFAPRKFLIEHKSRGEDLDDAFKQALDYFDSLASEIRPKYIIVSDFARIRIYDLERAIDERVVEFKLEDFPGQVRQLGFFTEEDVRVYEPEEHIDVKAVRVIGKLHKALKTANYQPEHLPRLLTRLVFCFFADDIGIFEHNSMRRYIEENTRKDGADVGEKLHNIFEILDTPDGTAGSKNERQDGTIDVLRAMPWVNGGMFAGPTRLLQGTGEIREMLLECMAFDWSQVSPAIFGSMFQSVMNEQERHDLGAHYTSETNIKKVINGLFLEELQEELNVAATNKERLHTLWEKITAITLLDPACGCGNFLVISYRELRAIENEIIRRIYGREDKRGAAHAAQHVRMNLAMDLNTISKLSVERMYGIEIDPFPVEVAKLSLWLVDHKMNIELGKIFGKHLVKLPLKETPHIVQGNALRIDWESVVPKENLTYILGNPPFNGAANKTPEQIEDMETVFDGGRGGKLDYVAAWYKRAIEYIQDKQISAAFVSTNSIVQGEQVALLWPILWEHGFNINFAHQTFKWTNEAPGKAAVFCVVVGFSRENTPAKLYTYDNISAQPTVRNASNINGYLVDGPNIVIDKRRTPIGDVPAMVRGSIPYDNGMLLMSEEEKDKIIASEPRISMYIRRYGGAREVLSNEWRYCLWLVDAEPEKLREIPEIMQRIEAVRTFRELGTTESLRRAASKPALFGDIRQPSSDYLMFPRVSSERRVYLPLEYIDSQTILADSAYGIPNASHYVYGVLQSIMHMAWMRSVAGRLKSDYRYSNNIVYNNFPWPKNPTALHKSEVEKAAQTLLDAREKHHGQTLAALYDPLIMPSDLLQAHHALDRAVDACYGKKNFKSESERLEFLFERYKELTRT